MFPVSLIISLLSFLGLMHYRDEAKPDKHSSDMGLLLHENRLQNYQTINNKKLETRCKGIRLEYKYNFVKMEDMLEGILSCQKKNCVYLISMLYCPMPPNVQRN